MRDADADRRRCCRSRRRPRRPTGRGRRRSARALAPPAAPPASGIVPPGHRVRPGDDLGLVAGLRVDEQQHDRVRSVVDRGEGLRGRLAPGRARVAALRRRRRPRSERRGERDRRAARLDRGRPRRSPPSRSCRRHGRRLRPPAPRRDGVGIDVTGGEDEHEPRLAAEVGDRALDGFAQAPATRRRRGAGHAFTDVGCGCWGHCRRRPSRGTYVRSYRRLRGEPKLAGARVCVVLPCGPRRLAALAALVVALAVARRRGRRGRAVRRLERAPARALASVRPDEPRRLHRRPRPVRRQDGSRHDAALRRARVLVRPQRDLLAHLPARHRGVPAHGRGAVLRRHAVRQLRGHALRPLLLRRVRRLERRADRAASRPRGGSRSTPRAARRSRQRATCCSGSTRTFSAICRSCSTPSGLVRPDGTSRKADHDRVNVILNRVTDDILAEIARRFDPTVDDTNLPTTLDDAALFQTARGLAREGVAERRAARGGADAGGARARGGARSRRTRRRKRVRSCASTGYLPLLRRQRCARRLLRRPPRRRRSRRLTD